MAKTVSLKQIKALRDQLGVGIMEAKRALIQGRGDVTKAKELLKQWGTAKLAGRDDKEAKEGGIFAYTHHDGRLGSLVKLTCETDFVARSDEFSTLGKELCLQVAGMGAKTPEELLAQAYVRDAAKTIADLINATAVRVKEKILVAEIVRLTI